MISEQTITKICTECGKNLPIDEFRVFTSGVLNVPYTRGKCINCEHKLNNQHTYDIKLQFMEHYGCKCNWPGCNVTEIAFLTGDHVDNDGALHRKEIGSGHPFHCWLINNNFPPGFQILCWNHQHLKQLEFNKLGYKLAAGNIYTRKYLHNLRLLVISHYGGRCTCCGETQIEFLTIDHINNNGSEHRKIVRSGAPIYRWLIKNNFPPGFQVLCRNCNCGRSINGGVCPHKNKGE